VPHGELTNPVRREGHFVLRSHHLEPPSSFVNVAIQVQSTWHVNRNLQTFPLPGEMVDMPVLSAYTRHRPRDDGCAMRKRSGRPITSTQIVKTQANRELPHSELGTSER